MKKGRRYAEHRGFSLSAMILVGIGFAAVCWFAVEMFVAGREENRDRSAASGVSLVSSARSEAPKPSSALQSGTVPTADAWALVLVNFDHKLPDSFLPDLKQDDGVEMDSRIVEPFEAMRAAAKTEGLSLYASSAYRSNQLQSELFRQEVSQNSKLYPTASQAEAVAAESVARPGYSEHGTGLAIDLNGVQDSFVQTKEYQWLLEHAQDYGFILRYPADKQDITHIKFEPWHFRYVGIENAEKMKQSNICLEEYLDSLEKTGTLH